MTILCWLAVTMQAANVTLYATSSHPNHVLLAIYVGVLAFIFGAAVDTTIRDARR